MSEHDHSGPETIARRDFLARAGGGVGGMALAYLLGAEGLLGADAAGASSLSTDPLRARRGHFPGKAKRVISLFMFGGISHIDTFDPKIELDKQDGQSVAKRPGFDTGGRSAPGNLMRSPWQFKKYGKCGMPVSDLLPAIGGCADDLALIHQCHDRVGAAPCGRDGVSARRTLLPSALESAQTATG